MITIAAASLLLASAALVPDVAASGVPRPGVAEFGALEPGVATWHSSGGVAGEGIAAPRDPFSPAALAPADVDLLLSITDAAAARRAVLQLPVGPALGQILRESAGTSVWRALVARIEEARRPLEPQPAERPIDDSDLAERGVEPSESSERALVDPAFDRFVDEFFGREATLVARRFSDDGGGRELGGHAFSGHGLEWAVYTRVERETLEPLLDRLSPQVLGRGWRALVGTELTYAFRGDLLVLAPLARPQLGEAVVTLIDIGGARLAGTTELDDARRLEANDGELGAAALATVELFVRQARVHSAGDSSVLAPAGTSVSTFGSSPAGGWSAIAASLSPRGTFTLRHRSSFDQAMFAEVPERAIDFAAIRQATGNSTVALLDSAWSRGLHGTSSDGGHQTMIPEVSVVAGGWPAGALVDQGGDQGAAAASVGAGRSSPLESLAGFIRMPAFVVVATPGDPRAGKASGEGAGASSPSSILREIAEAENAVRLQDAEIKAHVRGGKRDAASVVRLGGPGDFPSERSPREMPRQKHAAPSGVRFVSGPAGDFIVVGDDERALGQLADRLASPALAGDSAAAPLRVKSMGSMRGVDLATELGLRGGNDPGSMRWLVPVARTLSRIEWRVIQPDTRTLEVGAEIELAPRAGK